MNRWLKLLTISGTVCCVLGIGAITCGAVMGGGRDLTQNIGRLSDQDGWGLAENAGRLADRDGRYLEQKIDCPDDWDGCGEHGILKHSEHSSRAMPGSQELPLASENLMENVRKIELEVIQNRVELRESDELRDGQVMIAFGDGNGAGYQVLQSGNELKVKDALRNRSDHALGNMILYVPVGFRFAEIEIENRGGSFQADRIFADELSLEVSGGDITVLGGSVNKLEAECDGAELSCMAAAEKEVSAECRSGDLYLVLAGDVEDYDYKMECRAGSILLESETPIEVAGADAERKLNHGTGREVELECTAGAIAVGYEQSAV